MPLPSIISLTPSSGPTAGGLLVEVRGEGFPVGPLRLKGVRYLIIDPLHGGEPRYQWRGATRIDLWGADPDVTGRLGPHDGAFAARFYVSGINACIHFEAADAELVSA